MNKKLTDLKNGDLIVYYPLFENDYRFDKIKENLYLKRVVVAYGGRSIRKTGIFLGKFKIQTRSSQFYDEIRTITVCKVLIDEKIRLIERKDLIKIEVDELD